jgi:hypothetical protein
VRDPQQIQKPAEAELPLEKVYSEWPVGTDPAVHVKSVTELFKSGVTIVNSTPGKRTRKK